MTETAETVEKVVREIKVNKFQYARMMLTAGRPEEVHRIVQETVNEIAQKVSTGLTSVEFERFQHAYAVLVLMGNDTYRGKGKTLDAEMQALRNVVDAKLFNLARLEPAAAE